MVKRTRRHAHDARAGQATTPPEKTGRALAPGTAVRVVHAKPWKRTITMSGVVESWDGDLLVLRRTFSGGGRYDSLDLPKLHGDWGRIAVSPGAWVLRRAYYRQDGALIGELYNVQTPADFSDGAVRYVDLEIDVVRFPDGRVLVVDEDDLAAAVRAGGIRPEVADRARQVAHRLADVLRAGGDWRTAERPSVERA